VLILKKCDEDCYIDAFFTLNYILSAVAERALA
jgi:hypothetical protein